MPLIETTGAASSRGFGQFARSVAANYIEDVFQTWLYTGNGSTQTITNGVDLAGKGGLVWIKARNSGTEGHFLFDTSRGINKYIQSQNSSGQTTVTDTLPAFNSNGFTIGTNGPTTSTLNYASWTFRKQPKFFDVVTYTGNSVNGRLINHSLGAVPGCIIIKRTDVAGDWAVWHVSAGNGRQYLRLNSTDGRSGTANTFWLGAHTSTQFQVGGSSAELDVNLTGGTYVAYLFAHNAGGFGASGTDNVISCGSWVGTGSPVTVNLGWEPQFILWKASSVSSNWRIADNMRGMTGSDNGQGQVNTLVPNTSSAETVGDFFLGSTPTGFVTDGETGDFIYIAIRRGPMRTPTTGTSVFVPQTFTGTGTNSRVFTGSGFPIDLILLGSRDAAQFQSFWNIDRLRGPLVKMQTASTQGDTYNNTSYFVSQLDSMDGYTGGTLDFNQVNNSGSTRVQYFMRRAPGFFDVVCYTGTGSSNLTVNHNLAAVPELMITKRRNNGTDSWFISALFGVSSYQQGAFDGGAFGAQTYNVYYLVSKPTSTSFAVRDSGFANHGMNVNGSTYVNYLFATVAGVSKVGSYTGTGTTLQINCGFTGGARFVLIKRTDSTGDWYVWDSARGIVAGNDPYLLLNSTAAEVTNTDFVDTFSSGFEISSTAPAAINANGGTFIFLAIA